MPRKDLCAEVLPDTCHGRKGKWNDIVGRQRHCAKVLRQAEGDVSKKTKDNRCDWRIISRAERVGGAGIG